MFLHLGGDIMVPNKEVIAIFDLKMHCADATKEFLKICNEEGFVVVIDEKETKSFVVTNKKVYYSPISSLTLRKRANFMNELETA